MENLYKKLDLTKSKNKKKTLDIVLSNNHVTLAIIEYIFSKVYEYLDTYKYEYCNYKDEFDSIMLHCSDIKISSKKEESSFFVPRKYLDDMLDIITNFFTKYHLGRIFKYYDDIKISLNCTVHEFKNAIMAYKAFIDESIKEKDKQQLSNVLDKFDYTETLIEDTVANDLFYKLYEKNFLDNRIRKIINNKIFLIDHNNSIMNNSDLKVKISMSYSSAKNSNASSDNIIIPKKYFNPLSSLIYDFIVCNKLGKVYTRDGFNDIIILQIYIDCSLEELLNAYYMEKQKIQYNIPNSQTKTKNLK